MHQPVEIPSEHDDEETFFSAGMDGDEIIVATNMTDEQVQRLIDAMQDELDSAAHGMCYLH
jgi:hypothetical protein